MVEKHTSGHVVQHIETDVSGSDPFERKPVSITYVSPKLNYLFLPCAKNQGRKLPWKLLEPEIDQVQVHVQEVKNKVRYTLS